MRGNKYKISKKRRLRRRGKYSKKLKTKSRKDGGWFSSIRGHEKNKVKIRATCKIPEFFFTSYNLFYEIMGMSPPVEQTEYPNAGIDISVYGNLLKKTDSTLLVKLDSPATIDDVYFNIQGRDRVTPQEMHDGKNKLEIDVTSMTFNVKKLHTYNVPGDGKGQIFPTPIKCSEYEAIKPEEVFVCKDIDDRILKLLLHLWRKKYTNLVKQLDVFFHEFCDQYPSIVTQFRKHEYNFEVKRIILSSS